MSSNKVHSQESEEGKVTDPDKPDAPIAYQSVSINAEPTNAEADSPK